MQPLNNTNPFDATWILVYLPVILFVILLFYFMGWLKKDGFKLAEALSIDPTDQQALDVQTASLNQAPPAMAAGNPAPSLPPQPVVKRSSSRLAAFLSALTAVIISICITAYYAYFTIIKGTAPDFQSLWPILASLGIGVIPYATKAISK
jgi:hypothetical protein